MSQIVAKLQSPFKQINPFVRFTVSFHPPLYQSGESCPGDDEGNNAKEDNEDGVSKDNDEKKETFIAKSLLIY